MPLQLLVISPRGTGKTTAANALADKLGARLISRKLSQSVPHGHTGPFVVDDLSEQPLEIQRWVLHNLISKDFYLFSCTTNLDRMLSPLARYLSHLYPEYFL